MLCLYSRQTRFWQKLKKFVNFEKNHLGLGRKNFCRFVKIAFYFYRKWFWLKFAFRWKTTFFQVFVEFELKIPAALSRLHSICRKEHFWDLLADCSSGLLPITSLTLSKQSSPSLSQKHFYMCSRTFVFRESWNDLSN